MPAATAKKKATKANKKKATKHRVIQFSAMQRGFHLCNDSVPAKLLISGGGVTQKRFHP
jgi:regulator of replication initiation timing